jgi:hypothetical protein
MTKVKVLITVKTYPTLSSFREEELVCTAGITEKGEWLRLYPIPFRKLNYASQYSKYEWIEIDIEKNTKDFRKESYKLISIDNPIKSLGTIDTANNWNKRKDIVFRAQKYTNLKFLINEAYDENKHTSLALFKPTRIVDFIYTEDDPEWDKSTLECLSQGNLFENISHFRVVRKLPFKFSYVFEDDERQISRLMIEDWEIGALYWKIYDKTQKAKEACIKVKNKYLDDFVSSKELYFFLGTNFINLALVIQYPHYICRILSATRDGSRQT